MQLVYLFRSVNRRIYQSADCSPPLKTNGWSISLELWPLRAPIHLFLRFSQLPDQPLMSLWPLSKGDKKGTVLGVLSLWLFLLMS